jgi:hypothetical protein
MQIMARLCMSADGPHHVRTGAEQRMVAVAGSAATPVDNFRRLAAELGAAELARIVDALTTLSAALDVLEGE